MCGIAGFTWADSSLIKKMTQIIKHRGPDDVGFHVASGISLGHRRLSIIDLSPKGHQPMFNETRDIVVIFNGEIWNYKKLKEELIEKGHIFRGASDTEVIVHGYESYGEKICSMLEGMFAFALYDVKQRKLLLARDRLGKKPLYYAETKKGLLFSSEIKSLIVDSVSLSLDNETLSDYLSQRFSSRNKTIFDKIKKVTPGSYVVYKDKKLESKIYYVLTQFNTRNEPLIKKADSLIKDAIQKRLMSDVPLGVFLSGGLDSSAIVAYMSQMSSNIKTFSVAFNSKVDESKYARIIAEKFKTEHHEIRVDSDLLRYLPEVIWHLDEPLADPACLPTYFLCREVSKHVKVALSGEGGDEIFGGYQSFNYIPEIKIIQKFPRPVRSALASSAFSLAKYKSYPEKHKFLAIASILKKDSLKESFKELFYFAFDTKERLEIFPKALEEDAFDRIFAESSSLDETAQVYYFREWLPNDLLMKADKMSMAFGLEVRTPFLDQDLLEYFSGLDPKEKRKRKLFKQVVANYLPSEIINKKKQGFTLPLFEWFGNRETLERVRPFLERLKKRNIFSEKVIENLLQNPTAFKNEHKIWVLLNFEIWYELYMEKIPLKEIKL